MNAEHADAVRSYSSPACMLHELDAEFAPRPGPQPPTDPAQEWEEVRAWRTVKQAILAKRRRFMSSVERVAPSRLITETLLRLLPAHPGSVIGL